MPPHCNTLDGPVVLAAKKAIEDVNVLHVLPWVSKESEKEVRDAFEDVMHAREKGPDPRKVADQWFFETVVRLHQKGEGAPFIGLKPAGLDPGPAVRLAEKALESGDIEDVKEYFEDALGNEFLKRLERVKATAKAELGNTDAKRQYIQAKRSFLHLANELHHVLTRAEHNDRIREAEALVKEKLEGPYSKRHPVTAEAIAHHHI